MGLEHRLARHGCQLVVAVMVAASAQAADKPVTQMTETEFVEHFTCPEKLPDDPAREQGLNDFFRWVKANRPEMSVKEGLNLRLALLSMKGCARSQQGK